MKNGKIETTEGIELPNQGSVRMLRENENCKYFEIFEVDTTNQQRWKKKKRKEYLRRNSKLPETKLYSSSLIKMNEHLVRYSGAFLKWTRQEVRPMNQRSRKLIMHNPFERWHRHVSRKDDIDMCQEKKKEEDSSSLRTVYMHQCKVCIKKSKEWLTTTAI